MKNYLKKCKVKALNITSEEISDEQYFKIPSTSVSKLKLLDPECGGSPEKYKEGFQSGGYNESLLLGTILIVKH